MASVAEIAKKLGCSPATVSRALNPGTAHLVREKTRLRILAECEKSNYRPDNSARSLASGKTYKVAFILGNVAMDLGNQLSGIAMSAACDELQKNGYNMLILGADNLSMRDQDIVNFLRSGVADAYIIGESVVSDKVFDAIRECHAPIVTTGKTPLNKYSLHLRKDVASVYRDIWARIPDSFRNEDLIFCMAGCEPCRYSYILDTAPVGRDIPLLSIPKTVNVFAFDRALTREMLRDKVDLLKTKKLIWCASDLTALGIMDLLSEHGKTPGQDYFLIGYDNIEELSGLEDRAILSTVDSRWAEYGRMAAHLALEAIDKPQEKTVVFPLKYIPRKSFPF